MNYIEFTPALTAVTGILPTLWRDIPSIFSYGVLEMVGEYLVEWTNTMGYETQIPLYLVKGLNQTLKQDYQINYLGIGGKQPHSVSPLSAPPK
jgi:hypothetical protein